jgi:D-3-phosphoglycerate dehydrogenase
MQQTATSDAHTAEPGVNKCLVVQPIIQEALNLLRSGGVLPRLASSPAMDRVSEEIQDAVAVATRSAGLSAAAMDAAPNLLVIGVHGIGVDQVALQHATELGIPVVNTPTANTISVAEHALMLLLAASRRAIEADTAARRGDFNFKFNTPTTELHGKVLGIVGWGSIGRQFASMARDGLCMKVLVHSQSTTRLSSPATEIEWAESLDDLLRRADVVSLHVPADARTRGLIGAAQLAVMKSHAILINTSRGGVIDEVALAAALSSGHLFGAGIDVFDPEPPPTDHPLMGLPNAILTPHSAGSTREAQQRVAMQMAQQMLDVLSDRRPPHLVNSEVWERRRRVNCL